MIIGVDQHREAVSRDCDLDLWAYLRGAALAFMVGERAGV